MICLCGQTHLLIKYAWLLKLVTPTVFMNGKRGGDAIVIVIISVYFNLASQFSGSNKNKTQGGKTYSTCTPGGPLE